MEPICEYCEMPVDNFDRSDDVFQVDDRWWHGECYWQEIEHRRANERKDP